MNYNTERNDEIGSQKKIRFRRTGFQKKNQNRASLYSYSEISTMRRKKTTVILAEFCDKRKKRRVALRRVSFFFFVLVLESKTSRLKSVFKQPLSQNKTTARIIGRQDFIFSQSACYCSAI